MNKFMQVARKEAEQAAQEGEIPVGAAVFKDGVLICACHNLCEQTNDPTAHAELLAIQAAQKKLGGKNLSGCELYVTLEPCAMCAGAIHLSKLSRVYYGAYDAKSGALGGAVDLSQSGCFDYKTEIYAGIDELACEAILKDFFEKMRKEKRDD